MYDIYDYSFTLSQYNGGTKQEGAVSGSLMYVPDKNAAKAGDTITYTLYASNVKNVNALGALLNFQSADFDYCRWQSQGHLVHRRHEEPLRCQNRVCRR